MERDTKLKIAKDMFGKYFFGSEEIKNAFGLDVCSPNLKHDERVLKRLKDSHVLILGTGLSILDLRDLFGFSDDPCFYNQDWYVNENFAKKKLDVDWYLLQREIPDETRGKLPRGKTKLPTAALTANAFFLNYCINKELMWENDYVWNSDKDMYGDRIYTGKYKNDAKDGFNVHRHLSIKNNYGSIKKI
jgi:hypothetical protein